MVLGFCIGGPFIWNLLKRAPGRVVAGVLAQPSGFRPDNARPVLPEQHQGLGAGAVERRSEITMDRPSAFLDKMYRGNADFVFTVTRDFVRNCRTPILILPDDVPAHPYAVALESAHARAQCAGQHLSLEGEPGADPARAAPRAGVPQGASAGHSHAAAARSRRPVRRAQ